jgi:hypothetical protein
VNTAEGHAAALHSDLPFRLSAAHGRIVNFLPLQFYARTIEPNIVSAKSSPEVRRSTTGRAQHHSSGRRHQEMVIGDV